MRKIIVLTIMVLASIASASDFSVERLNAIKKSLQENISSSGRNISVDVTMLEAVGEYAYIRITTKEGGNQGNDQLVFTDGKYLFPDIIDVKTSTGMRDELTFKYTAGENIDYSFLSLVYGKKDAKNIIIEVSDFQCPYCRNAHKYLTPKYAGKDVAVYMMHMPLPFHPKARLYAKIFEAAREQNINLAEELYSTSSEFDKKNDDEIIRFYSAKVADKGKFLKAVSESRIDARIDAQMRYAQSYKIQGTPHIFFNGKPVSGFRTNLYDIALKGM